MNWFIFFRTLSKNLSPVSRTAYLQTLRSSSNSTKVDHYLDVALNGYEETKFMPLRFKENGWRVGDSFSTAFITTLQYLRDDVGLREPGTVDVNEVKSGRVKTYLIPFKSLFYHGFQALESFRDETPIRLPEEKTENDRYLLQYATNALVAGFLCDKEYQEECLQMIRGEELNEAAISTVMANHLFSKLASPKAVYYVTNDTKAKPLICMCSKQCGEEIMYCNTSFGSELLWYGKPDIMVFPSGNASTSIVLPRKHEECHFHDDYEDEISVSDDQQVIENQQDSLRGRSVPQIVATAITFSMYQRRLQKKYIRRKKHPFSFVSLIPLIAANGKAFDIYLYDSENDILLRNCGKPIALWKGPYETPPFFRLNLFSILKLWMAINHLSIQPALSLEDRQSLSGTCAFKTKLSKEYLRNIDITLQRKPSFESIHLRDAKEFDF